MNSITDDLIAEIEKDFDQHRSHADFMKAGGDWAPYIPLIIQRVRQLEKDAARYRWLRKPESECNVEIPCEASGAWEMPSYNDSLDEAIDRHMQATQ